MCQLWLCPLPVEVPPAHLPMHPLSLVLRSAGVEQLMYIKEDLIIPHVSPWARAHVRRRGVESGLQASTVCP